MLGLPRQHPRFARLSWAAALSSVGDPLSLTLSQFLLYQATHSPFALAGIYVAQIGGALLVGFLLGAVSDRLDRRLLIVSLEVVRTILVALLPLATLLSPFTLYPALVVVGGIEAIVQPARLAGVPRLVAAEHLERANARIVLLVSLGQAAGFALAGLLIVSLPQPRLLFLVDALTFALAGALVLSVGSLGGGTRAARLSGGVLRALAVPSIRPHLVIAGTVTVAAMMLPPALLPLSYKLSSDGVTVYAWLQVLLIAGLTAGSLLAHRTGAGLRVLALSLWVFSVGALVAGLGHTFWVIGAGIVVSSVGNSLYFIANQSALLKAADDTFRGSVMSTRYTVTQSGRVIGLLAGAWITTLSSGSTTLAVIGLVLLAVAVPVSRWWLMQRPPRGPASGPRAYGGLAGRAHR